MREDVLTVSNKRTSVKAEGGVVCSVRNKNITKKWARIIKDGKLYSSSFVGPIDHVKLLQEAHKNESGAIPCPFPLPEVNSLSRTDSMKTEGDMFTQFKDALNWLKQKHPNFIFSGGGHLSRVVESLDVNGGSKMEHEVDICRYDLGYKHKNSASIMDGGFGEMFVYDFDIESSVQHYSPFLKAFENTVNVKPGHVPVVFIGSEMLFRKVLESARVDCYQKGVGLFKDKLGEKILSEKLSLTDVSYKPEWLAMNLFDSVGFVRENPEFPILQNGVFKNLICDTRNAAKYNLKLTGNTKGFSSASGVGYNTIRLKEGTRSSQEILNELAECLVVEIASGGSVTDTGNFSTPVQNAFLVRNGTLVGKIPQITLTSSVEEMLGSRLIEIASDPIIPMANNPALFTEMNVFLN